MDWHRGNIINGIISQASVKGGVVGGDAVSRTWGDNGMLAQESTEFISYYVLKNVAKKPAYQLPRQFQRGHLSATYGDDNLFHRVWVSPLLIEVGFITEDDQFEVKIWNAWLAREVDFTAVSSIAPEGTLITYPTLPYTITRSDSLILTLDLYKEGPPVQDTFYGLTIDGDLYTTNITGTRVLPVEPDIQWDESLTISYEFATIMYQDGVRFQEQRRPLMEWADRVISATYLLEGNSAHKFFNVLSYGHDKVFGCPIYNEKMVASSITVDSNIIPLVTATDDLYNLNNNANYIIIVDHENELAEIKEIEAIASAQITTVKDIVETFDVGSTFIYPALISLLYAVSFTEQSDNVETMQVEFREFVA